MSSNTAPWTFLRCIPFFIGYTVYTQIMMSIFPIQNIRKLSYALIRPVSVVEPFAEAFPRKAPAPHNSQSLPVYYLIPAFIWMSLPDKYCTIFSKKILLMKRFPMSSLVALNVLTNYEKDAILRKTYRKLQTLLLLSGSKTPYQRKNKKSSLIWQIMSYEKAFHLYTGDNNYSLSPILFFEKIF